MPELTAHQQVIAGQITQAFTQRTGLMSFWQETAENFYPERADFTDKKTLGEAYASGLHASEPILFRRDFGNYIGAATRPWGKDWFSIEAQDPSVQRQNSVQRYLEHKTAVMRSLLRDRKSNFAAAARAGDHDWTTFGNAITSAEVRRDTVGLRFRTWHPRDCAWRLNYDGIIDTFYRRITVSIRNLVSQQKPQKWELAPQMKTKAEKEPNAEVEIYHVLIPASEFSDKESSVPYVSAYFDVANKWLIAAKPEPVFNYAVSRWFTLDSNPYGLSPSVICALPDGRSLQTMTWAIMEAGEKAVEPPLVATAEAVLSGVDIRSGMVTWVDRMYDERTGQAVRALEMGGTPEFGEALRTGITGNLKEAFYLSKLFLPEAGPQMTAQEIMRRHEEFLRVAQPVIEPAEDERNGTILDVAIELAWRAGFWGPMDEMPKELRGRDTSYTWNNPLQDARKQSATLAFNSSMQVFAQAKELLKPGVTEHFDEAVAFRDAIAGVAPPSWLRDENEANEAMETEQEAATAGQAAMEVGAMAETMSKAQAAQAKSAPQQVAA